jgi:hypothetical protein
MSEESSADVRPEADTSATASGCVAVWAGVLGVEVEGCWDAGVDRYWVDTKIDVITAPDCPRTYSAADGVMSAIQIFGIRHTNFLPPPLAHSFPSSVLPRQTNPCRKVFITLRPALRALVIHCRPTNTRSQVLITWQPSATRFDAFLVRGCLCITWNTAYPSIAV